ncbi:MAG: hypothetical protein ABIJ96_05705 [Elusimicrobiota bacterium]
MSADSCAELRRRLEVHFADQTDDEGLLDFLEELMSDPELALRIKRQLETAVVKGYPGALDLAENAANRWCEGSDDKARDWLRKILAPLQSP